MSLDLKEIRKEIDALDRQMVECFERRMNIVLKVADYKAQNNMCILDREREQQVINKNKALLHNPAYAQALQGVLEEVMRVSRELQTELLDNKTKEI